eukprot:15475420-Alexandrium_andersonii.AAC.2
MFASARHPPGVAVGLLSGNSDTAKELSVMYNELLAGALPDGLPLMDGTCTFCKRMCSGALSNDS